MSEWKTPRSLKEGAEIELDGMRITIHRLHGVAGLWFGTCHAMGVDRQELSATDLETAKGQFVGYLMARHHSWGVKLDRANRALTGGGE